MNDFPAHELGEHAVPAHSQPDACDLLDADHIAVKHLFVEYARLATGSRDDTGATRETLAMKICDELTVHAQVEEEVFYPALRGALADAGDALGEAHAEHAEVKQQVDAIRALPGPGDEMDVLVAELAGQVEHHVKEERDTLFPKARASRLDLMALRRDLEERQQALQSASV
ncbi:MAG: hemerythrin domain-containing protein [Burkholderiales bacterium]|nr:hemerythrin domain-containing protein [Burkholderiales bacterium]